MKKALPAALGLELIPTSDMAAVAGPLGRVMAEFVDTADARHFQTIFGDERDRELVALRAAFVEAIEGLGIHRDMEAACQGLDGIADLSERYSQRFVIFMRLVEAVAARDPEGAERLARAWEELDRALASRCAEYPFQNFA